MENYSSYGIYGNWIYGIYEIGFMELEC